MRTNLLPVRHRPERVRPCSRLTVLCTALVVLAVASCGGNKASDVVIPHDAEVTPPTPDAADSRVSPETSRTDVMDTADGADLAPDIRELAEGDGDAPALDGEVVPTPSLFPYKLAATFVLQLGDKKVTDPAAVSVGANGSLVCVVSGWSEDGRRVMCFSPTDGGDEMIPVDMSDVDEKLDEVGSEEIVGLALPTADNRIYIATLGSNTNSHLIVSSFDNNTKTINQTSSHILSSGDYSTDNMPAAMNNITTTSDGNFLYASHKKKLSSISLKSGIPSVTSIKLNSENSPPLLTVDSSGLRLIASSFGYFSCVGEWWVFNRDLTDGTLTLVADQHVFGDCSVAIEGVAGQTLAPAPVADHVLFTGPDVDDALALGIASLRPGTDKQAVSLLADLLPEYSPGTSSLATLPSHRLAALFLTTNYPVGPGLAIVQLDSDGTKADKIQFIGDADLAQGVGVDEKELFCGIPAGSFIGRIQEFSQDGRRLFLACSVWSEQQQELFGVLIGLASNN